MNIAFITDDYIPSTGGITNVIVNVRKGLRNLGEKVYLLNSSFHDYSTNQYKILKNKYTLQDLKNQSLKFYLFQILLFFKILFMFNSFSLSERLKLCYYFCFHPKNMVNRVTSLMNLKNFFQKHKIDLIICGKAIYPLDYGFILSQMFNLPLVTIAHGDDFLIRYPFNVNSIIFRNCQGVVVTNKIMKVLISKIHNIQKKKIKIINLGVDFSNSEVNKTKIELRDKYSIPKDQFVILTVSRLYPRKGFDIILSAIQNIIENKKNPNLHYYIIGSGEEEEKIRKLISLSKLDEYVDILGYVSNEKKNEFYALSDLFVLTPKVKKDSIEGFGIVYLEANFFYLPVIGSRSGGVRVAIQDGNTGYLVQPENVQDLAERINEMQENPKMRESMGKKGHKRVEEEFNWSKNVKRYHAYLKKMKEESQRG